MELANIFCKWSDNKHFRLCYSYGVYYLCPYGMKYVIDCKQMYVAETLNTEIWVSCSLYVNKIFFLII